MRKRISQSSATPQAKLSHADIRRLMDQDGRALGPRDPLDDLIEINAQFPYTGGELPKGDARAAFQVALTKQGIEPEVAGAIAKNAPASILENQKLRNGWVTSVIAAAEALAPSRPSPAFAGATRTGPDWRPSALYQGLRRDGDPEAFFLRAWEARLASELIEQFGRPTQNEVARADPKLIRGLRNKYTGALEELAQLVPPAYRGLKTKPLPTPEEAALMVAERRTRERLRSAEKRRSARPK